ncbi:low-specificity L-threonine aldolase [Pelagibius sp. Alg239-R121]|uniref:low-specificity L-threonine aldolase n=1 Tax=Pelagibius sp. Alg239-R121 TaxID=2993448 RepID=UPI0024A6BD46|nr:low-specificity L-threonine aldolase [Pelagibius sp. Alg239-R121]
MPDTALELEIPLAPGQRLDFRSDTLTRPSSHMRRAIAEAAVGDDYYREDPTVQTLEREVAALFGKEAAILNTSGTQSNLVAVMSHCTRGDAYIAGDGSHSHLNELGGAASLAGVQPKAVRNQPDGTLALEDIEAAINPDGLIFAPCRLLALENTIGGKVLPQNYVEAATNLARSRGLACHLDGARVFNASVALGLPVVEVVRPFDTISVCLSKGLGAPVGSLLVGSGDLIEQAHRHRQALGGGLRQAGILAAAGLYALEHNVERMAEDHARARRLAGALNLIEGVSADLPQSNIIFADVDPSIAGPFTDFLTEAGIRHSGSETRQRWVTHLDIDDEALEEAMSALKRFAEQG